MTKLGNKFAILARKGALSAAKKYYKMSVAGNIWNTGIESFISSTVAQKIHKATDYPVELEYSYNATLSSLDIAFNAKKHTTLTERSRFDIALFRKKNKKPYGIIEVKKRFADFSLKNDINKIADAINNCSKEENRGLRFGIILVLESKRENQQKDIEKKIDEIFERNDVLNGFNTYTDWSEISFNSGMSKNGVQIEGAVACSILMYK